MPSNVRSCASGATPLLLSALDGPLRGVLRDHAGELRRRAGRGLDAQARGLVPHFGIGERLVRRGIDPRHQFGDSCLVMVGP